MPIADSGWFHNSYRFNVGEQRKCDQGTECGPDLWVENMPKLFTTHPILSLACRQLFPVKVPIQVYGVRKKIAPVGDHKIAWKSYSINPLVSPAVVHFYGPDWWNSSSLPNSRWSFILFRYVLKEKKTSAMMMRREAKENQSHFNWQTFPVRCFGTWKLVMRTFYPFVGLVFSWI